MKTKGMAILALILLVACNQASQSQQPYPTPILYMTLPADATSTPTPFFPAEDLNPIYPFIETQSLLGFISTFPSPTPDYLAILPDEVSPPFNFNPSSLYTPFPYITDQETVTYLLLGSDVRSGASFRTDTMIIAALRPRLGQISLVSIPRDLWVYIPAWGMQRINTAYLHGEQTQYSGGGPSLIKDTILYNLGIRIDHTALVDFNGFKRILDTLGGIEVPVACQFTDWRLIDPNADPQIKSNWSLFSVGPGIVSMNGEMALWYARSRKKSNDFDRGRRQQEILRAIFSKFLKANSITKIPQLYNDLSSSINTDLSLSSIMELAPFVLSLNNADIRSYYIRPPLVFSWTTARGAYVLSPSELALQAMLLEAMSPSQKKVEIEPVTIEIRNGTPFSGWDLLAGERLNYAGYKTKLAAPDRNNYSTSLLYDFTQTQDPNKLASLLAILALPQTAVVSQPQPDTSADYVLIVGSDYKPCFNPVNLAP
jgi:LCP family protein required for cell wall assembly